MQMYVCYIIHFLFAQNMIYWNTPIYLSICRINQDRASVLLLHLIQGPRYVSIKYKEYHISCIYVYSFIYSRFQRSVNRLFQKQEFRNHQVYNDNADEYQTTRSGEIELWF